MQKQEYDAAHDAASGSGGGSSSASSVGSGGIDYVQVPPQLGMYLVLPPSLAMASHTIPLVPGGFIVQPMLPVTATAAAATATATTGMPYMCGVKPVVPGSSLSVPVQPHVPAAIMASMASSRVGDLHSSSSSGGGVGGGGNGGGSISVGSGGGVGGSVDSGVGGVGGWQTLPRGTPSKRKPSSGSAAVVPNAKKQKSKKRVAATATEGKEAKKKNSFKCSVCSRAFGRRSHLTTHMRMHTGERPFKCETCGKLFTQRGNLTLHKRLHTGARPFKCDVCGKAFVVKGNLKVHMMVHSNDRVKRR